MLLPSALLKKKIDHALVWAFIEACGYKIVYLILHFHFFKKLSLSLYTLQATTFALVYISVTIFNRGFDQALLYHFNQWALSLIGLRRLVTTFIYHTSITILLVLATAIVSYYIHIFDLPTYDLLIILGLLLIVETIKKNLKVILYLTFYNTYVACAELIGLTTYACFAIHHLLCNSSDITPLFSYLLYVNSSIVLFFIICFYIYYYNHTSKSESTTSIYNTKLQYQSYLLQLVKVLVSSQFLMPFYALSMQLGDSAYLFIISTIIQSGEFILYKLCYISGSTFFVYDSSVNTFLSDHMRSILLKRLIPFYTIVVLLSWIPIFYILPLTTTNMHFTLLYGATLLVDNFLLLYEKYAIIHNRILAYLIYSFILCTITWLALYIFKAHHIFIAITFFFIGKVFLLTLIYRKDKNLNLNH